MGLTDTARLLPSRREFQSHPWLHIVDWEPGHQSLKQGLVEVIQKGNLVEAGKEARRYAEQEMAIGTSARDLITHLQLYLDT